MNETGAFQFHSIHPVLAVRDLEQEVGYYVEKLGFQVSWRWGDPTVRAGVGRDGLELQLVANRQFAPEHLSFVYVLVSGVDAYFGRCLQRGVRVVTPLGDRPFGVRDFRVEDLSGNRLGFGEALSA